LLLEAGCRVSVYDPEAMKNTYAVFKDRIQYAPGNYEACDGAGALLVVTEWNEFRRPDFTRLRELLSEPVIIDGRNLYNPSRLRELGFCYYCIGRPPVT
jgi:UDPglucose 6-dehydrogenase